MAALVAGAAKRVITLGTAMAGLALAGCATTQPGVLAVKRVDRSQFEVTSHVIGSPAGVDRVKAQNDETATKYCQQNGQPMVVVDRRSYGGVASQDILTFRCGNATMARAKMPAAIDSHASAIPAAPATVLR